MTPRADLYPLGRKFCSRCGCWRLLLDFGTDGRWSGVLKSRCRACERVVGRWRNAIRRGRTRPYGQWAKATHCHKGHPLSEDNVHYHMSGGYRCRTCKICDRERKHTPEYREWNRFRLEARRRKAGIKPRSLRKSAPRGKNERMELPAGPFGDWLKRLVDEHGWVVASTKTGMDRRRIYGYVVGETKTAHIDVVDRAVVNEGETFLWDIYPDLYDMQEAA